MYLLGKHVSNEGIITTPQGETLLAAGNTIQLIDSATPGVKVEITGAEGNATNLGQITAEAGRIGIAGVIVRNSGLLNASSVVEEGGRVFLKASQDAYVDGAGRIVTTGRKGGSIDVLGNRVAVMDQAELDASGREGGGRIRVGGDYQGANPDIQNAEVTYFGPDAVIKANATENGNGGTVIVWADDTTRAYGRIEARGGAEGGNGGFVEVSGKEHLTYRAVTDLRAANGEAGHLLLDPGDITIVQNDTTYGDTTGLGTGVLGAFDGSGAYIGWNTITEQLGLGHLSLTTLSGTITVSQSPGVSNISLTHTTPEHSYSNTWYGAGYSSSNNLSLLAGGSIYVRAAFGNAGSGNILLMAGWDGVSTTSPTAMGYTANKNINIDAGGAILSGGSGSVTLVAPDIISLEAASTGGAHIDMNSGSLSMTANAINLTGSYGGAPNTGHQASIRTNGNQTFTITGAAAGSQLMLYGASNDGALTAAGGYASIVRYGGTGGQNFYFNGSNVNVSINGGSGTGTVSGWTGDCALAGANCSANFATIENWGGGGQLFQFGGAGGSVYVQGGSVGNNNFAGIENNSGTQIIQGTTQANHPTLRVEGGASGGNVLWTGSDWEEFDNGAWIGSEAGQVIKVASLGVYGGATGFTSAGLGAPSQTIEVGGDMVLAAGGAAAPSSIPGSVYLDYGSATIGWMSGHSLNLTVGGTLTMTGGAHTEDVGGSRAGMGSRYGASSMVVDVTGNVTLFGTSQWAARMGSSRNVSGGSLVLKSGGAISLGNARVGNGPSGSIAIAAYGGGVQQATGASGGLIGTGSLSVEGATIDLQGYNLAGNVYLKGGPAQPMYYTTYRDVHIGSDTTNQSTIIGISSIPGSPYGGDIFLGAFKAGTVAVSANGGIYDDNGSGVANITASTATLVSYGGNAGDLAISVDVANTATVNGNVFWSSGNYGGISVRSTGTAPTNVALSSNAQYDNNISYTHSGSNLTLAANHSFTASYGGDIYVGVSGGSSLTEGTATYNTYGSVLLVSEGALYVAGALSTTGDIGLVGSLVDVGATRSVTSSTGDVLLAGGTVTVNSSGSVSATVGDVAVVAGTTNVYGGISATAGSVGVVGGVVNIYGSGSIDGNSVYVAGSNVSLLGGGSIYADDTAAVLTTGNLTLDGGSYIESMYSVDLMVGGDLRVNNGSSISSYEEIYIDLLSSTSTLYLNELASMSPVSRIEVSIPQSIHLNFTSRTEGGVVVDGVATTKTVAGGSGFFVNGAPATAGNGFYVAYAPPLNDTSALTATLATATNSASTTSNPTSSSAPPPPPPPSGGSTGSSLSGTSKGGTVGGEAGTFGGGDGGGQQGSGNSQNGNGDDEGEAKEGGQGGSGQGQRRGGGRKPVQRCT